MHPPPKVFKHTSKGPKDTLNYKGELVVVDQGTMNPVMAGGTPNGSGMYVEC
jgi:hypothetical protein